MHIYIDKLKQPRIAKFDKVIDSFKDFINTVDKNEIAFMSIGYEIDSKSNAIDALWYLKENDIFIPFINIHSDNSLARNNISKMIKKNFNDTIVTFIREI